jgi:hypothetical protein
MNRQEWEKRWMLENIRNKIFLEQEYKNKQKIKKEYEIKKEWEQRVQECEDNYWRSRLGKPLQ